MNLYFSLIIFISIIILIFGAVRGYRNGFVAELEGLVALILALVSLIIISGLVKMAISLGIETVVEGVETEAQVEFLKEIGCTKLQGFYYSKPIPEDEFISFLSSNNRHVIN